MFENWCNGVGGTKMMKNVFVCVGFFGKEMTKKSRN